MSYNIVKNGELVNIAGPSETVIVEGRPIYGPRVIYATNKALPKSGESPLTYTIDRDGILTGSVHKIGNGYSAFLMLNDQALENLDNYGTESGTFSFPNIRVKTGDVVKISTNVPTTESTNVFMLNIISVIPIVGMDMGEEIIVQKPTAAGQTLISVSDGTNGYKWELTEGVVRTVGTYEFTADVNASVSSSTTKYIQLIKLENLDTSKMYSIDIFLIQTTSGTINVPSVYTATSSTGANAKQIRLGASTNSTLGQNFSFLFKPTASTMYILYGVSGSGGALTVKKGSIVKATV